MSREPWFILVLILAYQPGAPATGQTVSETPSLTLRAGEPKVTEIPADVV
jgi:hypothetical protein